MTENTNVDPDWADRYLQDSLEAAGAETSAEYGPPPEASAYMDDLTDANLSYVHPANRDDHLETALKALVRAMKTERVAECDCHGRTAAAFYQDDRVVVTMLGLGELINVDQKTAALLAFAYECEPSTG